MNAKLVAAAAAGLIVLAGAGVPVVDWRPLTPDGADYYVITPGSTVSMMAPATNTGSNFRGVFYPHGAASVANSEVSATWTFQSAASVQEGLAFRVATKGGVTRAVTVTKNVWAEVYWGFNVHLWDTSKDPAFTQVAQFDMMRAVFRPDGSYQPFPWAAKARLVGSEFRFKLWFPATGMAEPRWDDPTYARIATVTANWSGRSGWYVGHIPAGGTAIYTGLKARTL